MTTAQPINIVRMITRLNIGGPAIHAALLSTSMDPDRFSTCLVVGTPDATEGDLSDLVQQNQGRVVHLKTLHRAIHPWHDLCSLVTLVRILNTERPQILHTHMAKAGALGRLAGLLYNAFGHGRQPGARVVLIHTFHGHVLDGYFPVWVTRVFVIIERWFARRTDRLIAVSQSIQDVLLEKGIGRREQWQVIPLGFDLSAFGKLPLSNGTSSIRVGLIGRLVPIKNPALFLEALAKVHQQRLGVLASGIIVGDGPLRPSLEREVTRLGLDGLVRLVGWQRDLPAVYSDLEATCVTSWNEGTPVAMIEAMAAGRTVVATDVGGVRDLLTDPSQPPVSIAPGGFSMTNRGVLVRAGDADGLAAALTTVATDAPLRRSLGEAARAYVMRRFGQERLLRDMTELYDALRKRRDQRT